MITCSGAAPRALEFYPSFKLGRLLNIIASTPGLLRARIRSDRNEVITLPRRRRRISVGYLQAIFVIYLGVNTLMTARAKVNWYSEDVR